MHQASHGSAPLGARRNADRDQVSAFQRVQALLLCVATFPDRRRGAGRLVEGALQPRELFAGVAEGLAG